MILAVALLGMGGAWPWSATLGLACLAALLTLDGTSLAQTWLSEPVVVGCLTGALCGDLISGLAVGLPFQLMSSGNLPVGQGFTGERVSSVTAGAGAAILAGHRLPLLGQAGSESGALGWVLVAVALFSLIGYRVIRLERGAHFAWMLQGQWGLRAGDLRWFDRLQGRCLAATFLRGFFLTLLWLGVMVLVWMPLYARLPGFLTAALARLPMVTPAMAAGILIERYGLRVCWPWVLAGLLAAVGLGRSWG